MGESTRVLLVLIMRVILGHVGCAVADEGTGVQPVVRAYCHRHQAEGSECPHGGEKDLDPLLTHHAFKGNQKVEEEVSEKSERVGIRSANKKNLSKSRRTRKNLTKCSLLKKTANKEGEMMRSRRRRGAPVGGREGGDEKR